MTTEQILRIPLDSDGAYILMNVSSNGASPLDLKLLATEGESPYILNLKQSRIQKFRSKGSQLDESQWEAILHTIFLRRPLSESIEKSDSLETLEANATITGDQLVIIIRKNISGITRRLGEISLNKDDSQEIDSISWAATAVGRSSALEKEAEDLRSKYDAQSETLKRLNQQLEQFIEAKEQHENALFEKFAVLLNEKKSKIRNLLRLLKRAGIDAQKAVQAQNAQGTSNHTMPRTKAFKRKASNVPSSSESASDSNKGFDKMSVDQQGEPLEATTPERSDSSTTEDEAEAEAEAEVEAEVEKPEENKPAPVQPPQPAEETEAESPPAPNPPARARSPPPRRELPFASHQPTRATSSTPAEEKAGGVTQSEDQHGEETSDDEL